MDSLNSWRGWSGVHQSDDDGADEHASEQLVDGTRSDDPLAARRAIIKRAAAGAAVAGAAWMAPRVDGLSLMPDYASAATLPGAVSTTHNFVWKRAKDLNDGCWDPANDYPGEDYWGLNAGEAQPGSDTRGVAVTRTQPVAGQGNVSVTLNAGTQADAGANIPGTISFSGWDPPFNKLTGGQLVYRTRGTGTNTDEAGNYASPFAGFITVPAPTNTPITFTIPEAANNQGFSPSGEAQWANLSFQFNFGPG